ncbi:MAG: Nodulation protein NolT [Chlamydiae bacterium]|nr:Nodulation protein NolT [Chlamydiota bacterium]
MHKLGLFLLGFAVLLVGCESQMTIVNGIPEREANEIVVLLVSRGIQAEKSAAPVATTATVTTTTMFDISVPSSQITQALAVLNQAGLPRLKGTSLLDLFGTSGLVPSEMQDKIRYQEGLSEQLATTIRKMDGIIDANVQITFPSSEDEEKEVYTASVYVKHRGILDNPNSLTITKIKRLIASALPGLTPENVSVVADRAIYADITLETPESMEQQKDYVSIWSVVVAKESAFQFRLIFYIFIILLFLLASAVAWLVWKSSHMMKQEGGITSLIKPTPYGTGGAVAEIKEEEKHEEED